MPSDGAEELLKAVRKGWRSPSTSALRIEKAKTASFFHLRYAYEQ